MFQFCRSKIFRNRILEHRIQNGIVRVFIRLPLLLTSLGNERETQLTLREGKALEAISNWQLLICYVFLFIYNNNIEIYIEFMWWIIMFIITISKVCYDLYCRQAMKMICSFNSHNIIDILGN